MTSICDFAISKFSYWATWHQNKKASSQVRGAFGFLNPSMPSNDHSGISPCNISTNGVHFSLDTSLKPQAVMNTFLCDAVALSIAGSESTDTDALLAIQECECISGETTSAFKNKICHVTHSMEEVWSSTLDNHLLCLSGGFVFQ